MNHCWQGSRVRLVSLQACDGRFVALRNRTCEPASQWACPSAQTTERRCSPRLTICTNTVSSQKRVQRYNFFRKHASIWAKNYGKIHLVVYANKLIIAVELQVETIVEFGFITAVIFAPFGNNRIGEVRLDIGLYGFRN